MHRKITLVTIALATLFFGQQTYALSVAASAGNNSYGVEASLRLLPTLRGSIGYMHSDDSGRHADIYSASLMFTPPLPVLDLSVGTRYQYMDTGFGSGGGFGLAGSAFVPTPIPLTSIGGFGSYTPDAFTHGNLEESYEFGVQARVNLFSQTYLHGGYRYFRTEFEGQGSQTLDSGPVFGISAGF